MLTREGNELLTRVGRGTPCGELLRRYWQPAALAEELPPGGPPLPVRLLGEELVLFRDEQGRPGLLGLHCSHRGADLSYGRLEDGGLRCIYHGWLYDIHGRCLEQPGEPSWNAEFGVRNAESPSRHDLHSAFRVPHFAIKHTAYPCVEAGDLVLAYLGPGEPPCVPAYEFLQAAPEYRFASKVYHECNFQQSNEGNIDQAHVSFLHRMARETANAESDYVARDTSPVLDPEETEFGMRIYNIRKAEPGFNYVKISNFVLPNLAAVPGGGAGDGYSVNWHVPIDDTHHWKYVIQFRRSRPMDKELVRRSRSELTPDYHLIRNKANRYLQDREEMKTRTFIGLGSGFQAHDACATEGAGPIQDRTQEHLGYTDRVIIQARKMLFQAIREVQAGGEAPHVIRDPSRNTPPEIVVRAELVPSDIPWRDYWRSPSAQRQEVGV